jgi:hypothetical protein
VWIGSSVPAHSGWDSTFQTCEWLFIGSTRRRSRTTCRSSVERDETGGHPLPSFFTILVPRATGATTSVFSVSLAKKTVENAPVDKRAEGFGHKVQQIEAMARLVDQDGCFRRALVNYFAGSKIAPRRSISTWLLEWVFADRGRVWKKAACCDSCCRRLIRRRGELGFVQSVLVSDRS